MTSRTFLLNSAACALLLSVFGGCLITPEPDRALLPLSLCVPKVEDVEAGPDQLCRHLHSIGRPAPLDVEVGQRLPIEVDTHLHRTGSGYTMGQ